MRYILFSVLMAAAFSLFAQDKAVLFGKVTDAETGEALFAVNVFLIGTNYGTSTDLEGNFRIENISPGEYNVEFTYLGYEKKLFTGTKLSAGEEKELNVKLGMSALTLDEEVVIIGEKPLVDVEEAKTTSTLSQEVIEAAPSRPIESLINTQTGVVQSSEGVHIRGGRTYETGFYIDGVSAKDPLSGTGFGIDVGTNAISSVEVTTGGAGVEYGNATSGIVNTETRRGGDKLSANASYKRDNFGFNKDWQSTFNTQIFELGVGGPAKLVNKWLPGKLKYFASFKISFSDEFTRNLPVNINESGVTTYSRPADQVNSSLYPDTFWSPYQDNRWFSMLKLNYEITPRKKLMASYMKSLTINQNTNMLRITGNDVSFRPGYQYGFALQPDNANTYTHDTNLEMVRWLHTVSNRFSYNVTFSRLFVHLRADANGRDWRPDQVESEFDPKSITAYPSEYFNPEDSIVFVYPAPGLYNNGGIAPLWHDHYVEEYTLKAVAKIYSKDAKNTFFFGKEIKHQDMQWIDITRPWIGAPLELPDGEFTQSFRLGDVSDVWQVKPVKGAFFASDKLKFRGLIAEAGARLEYWFPGLYVDTAIANPEAPIREEVRQQYLEDTYGLFGRRFKMRLLPFLSASFPINENQMMFFNYRHSTVQPHPTYIYTGLNPYFADRSTLGKVGNPNLDPEVDISYEVGLKSQITLNDAFNITAYWKDKYDFITATSILIEDATGREVSRTMRINSDYARVRGIEVAYIKRIGKWFNGQISASYSVATGQSSSSSEALKEILATGNRETTKETPLAWDSPLDVKAFTLFTFNNKEGYLGKKWLNKFSWYFESIYRTGKRYTPYVLTGHEPTSGRPIYEPDPDPEMRFSKLGTPSFWINTSFKKWWSIKNNLAFALTLEITNLLNNKNTAIVNPVTGTAYRYGDPVPTEWRDPMYIDPRDPRSGNIPPFNPARFYEQRHVIFGASINF